VGSRVRVVAAACVVASGLLVGGVGTATALADVGNTATDDASSPIRKSDSEDGLDRNEKLVAEKPVDEKPVDEKPVDEKPVDDKPVDEIPVEEDPVEEDPVVENPVEGDPPVPGDKEPPLPPRPSCDKGEQDCGPWWPWPWPWPDPEPEPGDPPTSDHDSGGFPGGLPVGLPFPGPIIGVPPEPPIAEPFIPDVIDTVPGVGVAASGSPGAPLSVPVIVTTPAGLGAVPTGAGTGPRLPAAPRQGTAQPPPARQPLPATAGSNVAMPASSYRVGYGEYLRTAGPSQIAALAVPGLAGILVLTGAGGFVGYRQAKSGRAVRTAGTARFVN